MQLGDFGNQGLQSKLALMKAHNRPLNISTGQVGAFLGVEVPHTPQRNENGETFADVLAKSTSGSKTVEFSSHALRRIESRNIDVELDRLNKGVELAAEKGSNDALVLIDSTAFVVSIKNNIVITTMSGADLAGSVFTNIDSTIIM